MSFDQRFNDFSYNSLALICSYTNETAAEAVNGFGRVCHRWHDVMKTQCREMWRRFYLQLHPNSRAPRDTHHAFQQLAKLLRTRPAPGLRQAPGSVPLAQEVFDIENCTVDFSFQCPVAAHNLRRVKKARRGRAEQQQNKNKNNNADDTENDGDDDLVDLYCDICTKNVSLVTNKAQLISAANEGRCVRIPQEVAAQLSETLRNPNTVNNIAIVSCTDALFEYGRSMLHRAMQIYPAGGIVPRNPTRLLDEIVFRTETNPHLWRIRNVRVPRGATDFTADQVPEGYGGYQLVIVLGDPSTLDATKQGTQLYALQQTERIVNFEQMLERHSLQPEQEETNDDGGAAANGLGPEQHMTMLPKTPSNGRMLPEAAFALVWLAIERLILKPFRMPDTMMMGQIFIVRDVARSGPTVRKQALMMTETLNDAGKTAAATATNDSDGCSGGTTCALA